LRTGDQEMHNGKANTTSVKLKAHARKLLFFTKVCFSLSALNLKSFSFTPL
jgi:hypothetical protein